MNLPDLPVFECLGLLKAQLDANPDVILEAPPGAGKTTLVPLALLHEPWLQGRKILVLEPRRIAARSAAQRMAQLLGEKPGQTVGYRMRLESRVGPSTRIEVITEGILTRLLQQDPLLESVGLVIFDEFHERSLDSDLALALCLKGRELFGDSSTRTPRILVMSATLDAAGLSQVLGNAPVVSSKGRSYPVEIIHGQASKVGERITDRVFKVVQRVVVDHPDSSILVFLPGQAEIHRVAERLGEWLLERRLKGIQLYPLYGNLSLAEQQQAIAQCRHDGERKLVLATNIAETSLTIEGVDVVVDSGLARAARFNPATGMTALHTVKISRSSSIQRAGRAGRLRPGVCYRLWSEAQQQQLAEQTTPEILQADLAPLVMQLLRWGIDDPDELAWIDPPPPGAWGQAMDLLEVLNTLESRGKARVLTARGELVASLATHPRLAQMLLCGAEIGRAAEAAMLAAALSERDPLSGSDPDLAHRLEMLRGDVDCPRQHRGWLQRCRQLAQQLEGALRGLKVVRRLGPALSDAQLAGYLLACAYPERIARRRHSGGYQLANGRGAALPGDCALGRMQWLAVAEVSSLAGGRGEVIRTAAALDEALFEGILCDSIRQNTVVEWDQQAGRFVAECRTQIGGLVWKKSKLEQIPVEAKRAALIGLIKKQGLKNLLRWSEVNEQWCARVSLLRDVDPAGDWPDTRDSALLAAVEDWLGPYLDGVNTLQDFKKLNSEKILSNMLDWSQQQALEKMAPTRFDVPSGASRRIDYSQTPPVLAVKLQEMFGCESTPTIAGGRVELVVHLLSPAGRPLQVTRDLAGFWRSSYHDVKKEMKGRYPKHPWPDDPLQARPTARAKPRK